MVSVRTLGLLLFSMALSCHAPLVWAEKQIPSSPSDYVWDEAGALKSQTKKTVSGLLSAHSRKTGDQIVIAIFDSLEGEDLVAWTNQVFKNWKLGIKGKDNGVLLALYWKEHLARFEVGYGLEGVMTDSMSKRILAEVLVPSLKQGNSDQAITQTALSILETLKSPLILSGEAEKILATGGFSSGRSANSLPASDGGNAPGWFRSLIILIVVGFILLRRFFGGGRGSWRGGGGWGGGSGGWGNSGGSGNGGFSGGGGSSGGGGASDKW